MSRTNNSAEAWHLQWNKLFANRPKLSKFARKMLHEDKRWHKIFALYEVTPARGIRGVGLKRKRQYIETDEDLLRLYQNALNDPNPVNPVRYLRNIAINL